MSLSLSWQPTPDSALYLMLADNLVDGRGFTLWDEAHFHVPPGYPALLAALHTLGADEPVWGNGLSIVCALGAFVGVHAAMRRRFGPALALLALCGLAFSCIMHEVSIRMLSEAPFLLCLWWAVHRLERRRKFDLAVAALLLAVAVSVRLPGLPLVVGLALGYGLERFDASPRKAFLVLSASFAALALCLFAVLKWLPSDDPSAFDGVLPGLAARSPTEWFTTPVRNLWAAGPELVRLFIGQSAPAWSGWLLIGVPAAAGVAAHLADRKWLLPTAAAFYLVVCSCRSPLIARDLLPIAPILIVYWHLGVRRLLERLQVEPRAAWRAAVCTAAVLVVCNAPRMARDVWQVHRDSIVGPDASSVARQETAEFLRRSAEPSDRFVSLGEQRELSYLSGRWSTAAAEKWPAPHAAFQLQDWRRDMVHFVVFPSHVDVSGCLAEDCRELGFDLLFENSHYRVFGAPPLSARLPEHQVLDRATAPQVRR